MAVTPRSPGASALDHPNICTIHEVDETPTRELFLTMAYYDGETLKQRLERGPISVDDALDIAIQIAQALERAHQRRVRRFERDLHR